MPWNASFTSSASARKRKLAAPNLREKSFFYIPSLSCRTIVYKGLLLAPQIANFYLELSNSEVRSGLCLVHQRFSTNTFPTWHLAHPYRYICHNGEINTLRGNVNWMHARTSVLASPLFGDDIKKLEPIIAPGGSDSANLDNAVELLLLAGRSLPHVMEMLIPQAWLNDPTMPDDVKAFYEYHASLMEPWDGPAAVAFTDGRMIGAKLDRNGLRPGRFVVTESRLGDHGFRGRGVAGRSGGGSLQRPPRTRPHAAGGYGKGAHHSRRGNQEAIGGAPALRKVAEGKPGHAEAFGRSPARPCRTTTPPS